MENNMRQILLASLLVLLVCFAAAGQQTPAPQQPLTFYYDYTVNPGKEEEFMNLIKTVGAPVRDKLMAEGVILAWGMETPILRYPGGTTNLIWFSVANMDGVDKVLMAMEAQQAKLEADARASKSKPPSERLRETVDMSKTRDWLTTDQVFKVHLRRRACSQSRAITSSKLNQAKLLTIGGRGRNTTNRCSTS
jgi:hypothetical protein